MSDAGTTGAVSVATTEIEPERLARAYLSTVAEPPAVALSRLVASLGPLEAAERVRRGAVPDAVARETKARRDSDRAVEHLRAAAVIGARLLIPEDPQWPELAFQVFAQCTEDHLTAPLALWVRGPLDPVAVLERSVAVVGSRAATAYGLHVARDLAFGVARMGATVVSGAAFGIDGAAHRGALSADGPTVAVLACGVDRAYPAGHGRLLAEIIRTGLVVSEYPPGSVPARHRFLVRNRIIAGMAAGTVVVEAGWRSGSRRTAADASLLGRPVMAVPGPVTSALSVGCHELLRQPGTIAVTRAEEVIEAVGRIGLDLAAPRRPHSPVRPTDGLPSTVARVYDALSRDNLRAPARLSRESGLPEEVVRPALRRLAREGLAQRAAGGWRRAERRPATDVPVARTGR